MEPQSYVNAVYYPSWKVYDGLPPSSLQVQRITHVLYAFIGVNEDGCLKYFDEWADLNIDVDGVKGCLAALAQLKQNHPHIQALISFGGGAGSAEFPALAASPSARQQFACAARELVDRYGLDGIDIDWEHPDSPERGEDYISLLQSCRAAFPAPRYSITTALPCGEWALKHIPLSCAVDIDGGGLLDRIHVMAYDFAGPWSTEVGHHAQLRSPMSPDGSPPRHSCTVAGIAYLKSQGVPAEKLVLGIPAYARYFPGAHAPGQTFFAEACGEVDYRDIPSASCDAASVDYDVAGAWFVDPEKGFFTFDVPASMRLKAQYVKEEGLAGLFYWTGVGDVNGSRSLVRAGWEELRSGWEGE